MLPQSRIDLDFAPHDPDANSSPPAVKTLFRRSLTTAVALALAVGPVPPPLGGAAIAQPLPELPTLGEVAADDLSPANERKLGEAIMRQVARDPAYLPDPEATEYLNAVGYQLVANSPARPVRRATWTSRSSRCAIR